MPFEMTTKWRQNGYILKVTENAAKRLRHAISSPYDRFAVKKSNQPHREVKSYGSKKQTCESRISSGT